MSALGLRTASAASLLQASDDPAHQPFEPVRGRLAGGHDFRVIEGLARETRRRRW
jgi:hypothetical protein